MFSKNDSLALTIKNKILSNFINANIEVIFDKEQDEYFISTRNKELYYSEEYGMLVLEINQNLWKQGIFNFYFILDLRLNPFENMVKDTLFTSKETNSFTQWNLHTHTVSDDEHFIYYYPLAA